MLVQDHPVEYSHASNWRDNKWAAKVGYRFADGLICPSPFVRQDIIDWCGLDGSDVALVPNPMPAYTGALAAPPHPWLRDGEPPVFVHMSNMTYWKRLDLLVDAFAAVRRNHRARLLVVGEARPGRGARTIQRLGLEADADTVGWVDDPLQFAARACAFVLPSDEEGFAQVLTEAMSVGRPVITTDSLGGGPRFVTADGAYGLLVPRGDSTQLAEAMARMLDPEVRAATPGWAWSAWRRSPRRRARRISGVRGGTAGRRGLTDGHSRGRRPERPSPRGEPESRRIGSGALVDPGAAAQPPLALLVEQVAHLSRPEAPLRLQAAVQGQVPDLRPAVAAKSSSASTSWSSSPRPAASRRRPISELRTLPRS